MSVREWFWVCMVSIDQFLNTFFGPVLNHLLYPLHRFGDPDETLSSVLGKNARDGSCRGCYWVCRVLNRLDPEHCQKSIEADEGFRGK